jgi:hypothetical protein
MKFNALHCNAMQCRPQRLLELFTGYRATQAMVLEALARMGFRTDQTGSGLGSAAAVAAAKGKERSQVHWENTLREWGARDLHELVAHFVRIRFPIVVALNKIDLARPKPRAPPPTTTTPATTTATGVAASAEIAGSAAAVDPPADACVVARNVQRIRLALPHEAVACVSASLEWTLVKLRRAAAAASGRSGSSDVKDALDNEHCLPSGVPLGVLRRLRRDLRALRPFCRGTGVLDCVNRAVAAKQPVLVYVRGANCARCGVFFLACPPRASRGVGLGSFTFSTLRHGRAGTPCPTSNRARPSAAAVAVVASGVCWACAS